MIKCEQCGQKEEWEKVGFKGKLREKHGITFGELKNGWSGWICKACFNAHFPVRVWIKGVHHRWLRPKYAVRNGI